MAPANSIRRLFSRWDVDLRTLLRMVKAALPATIALAMYQSDIVAKEYTTMAYLMPVAAMFSRCSAPRGKYFHFLIQGLVLVCFGATSSLLMVYCCVKARQNTSQPAELSNVSTEDILSVPYNTAASVVAAIWLFFQTYIVNTLRGEDPQLGIPVQMHCMLFFVAATQAPDYVSVSSGFAFVKRLLLAMLTGMALATATHILIFPDTCREAVLQMMGRYISALQEALRVHESYFQSMERLDMFVRIQTRNPTEEKILYRAKADAIKNAARRVSQIHASLSNELPYAKREVAYGKPGVGEFGMIFRQLRATMVPIIGLSTVVDVFDRIMEWNNWIKPVEEGGVDPQRDAVHARMVHDWNAIMASTHDHFAQIFDAMHDGLEHVAYQLNLVKRPRKRKDIEASPDVRPGEEGFAKYLEGKCEAFYKARLITLREWCEQKGIELPEDYFYRTTRDQPIELPEDVPGALPRDRTERQLYILLYVEHMLYSSSLSILAFVLFADQRVASGKYSHNRLVVPGSKQFREFIRTLYRNEQNENTGEDAYRRRIILDLGEAYHRRKDPEHLPPENIVQSMGEWLRVIPSFLRSSRSLYGFRVACAALSIGIIAYVKDSHAFFVRQRLVWAMVMQTISMGPTSGQTVFNFVLRSSGTVIGMIAAMVVWYIPNGHIAGVIVLFFVYTTAIWWIPLKRPVLQQAGVVGMLTTIVIIASEMEVAKLGERAVEAGGQPYYPTYLLATFRLAVVVGGVAVAFLWTIFPYPISDHSVLRRDLGDSLYLLAKYYSLTHETLIARARGDEGDMTLKTSAGRRLEKARHKAYANQSMAINGLRSYADSIKWEIQVGGRFPRGQYARIIDCIQNIVNYINLAEYASRTFSSSTSIPAASQRSGWYTDFTKLITTTHATSHQITSILALLSASIMNAQPLPPYLQVPSPDTFSDRLKEVDKDILNICHAAEPGYAAFSVLHLASRCIVGDLERLIENVRGLVGELDFSFHVISRSSEREEEKID
ncbi:conserved hypothetical protein [Talaromyces stipitatus ATCC 10500]|uniref:ER transporter 6TM N-terminal domain-containing protein n=1 Tax=Talaromyces stipitatus (strain ATCC 10500 / CBS 375.48 / QM 6759 / NRRL 1006) TaxID=441959 RepID=B8LZ75_TALSN|nr:uncharacterized protein TSTA_083510 [Talaromyces stipitatus ATCC 10500]EED21119.1 conserved hypothetical protein [Talaromyces stipitatus ATCC 10500]